MQVDEIGNFSAHLLSWTDVWFGCCNLKVEFWGKWYQVLNDMKQILGYKSLNKQPVLR